MAAVAAESVTTGPLVPAEAPQFIDDSPAKDDRSVMVCLMELKMGFPHKLWSMSLLSRGDHCRAMRNPEETLHSGCSSANHRMRQLMPVREVEVESRNYHLRISACHFLLRQTRWDYGPGWCAHQCLQLPPQ